MPATIPRDYKAGQYVSVDPHQFPAIAGYAAYFEEAKGRKEPPRAYSMVLDAGRAATSPSPSRRSCSSAARRSIRRCSRPSSCTTRSRARRLEVTGYAGGYYLTERIADLTDHVVHLCAGSGSVPNVSMIKWGLAHLPAVAAHVHLLEQDLERHHLPRSADRARGAAPRSAARRPHDHARARDVPLHRSRAPRPRHRRAHRAAGRRREGLSCSTPAVRRSRCGTSARPKSKAASRRRASWSRSTPRSHELGVPKERFKEEAFG